MFKSPVLLQNDLIAIHHAWENLEAAVLGVCKSYPAIPVDSPHNQDDETVDSLRMIIS